MDNKRLEGRGHEIKGALEDGRGKIAGDAKLIADASSEGTAAEAVNSSDADGARIFDVDVDRIAGVGHQLKGALKRGLGNLIGDSKLKADGIAESRVGEAQNAAGSARDEKREAFANTLTAVDAVSQSEIETMMSRGLAEAKSKELAAAKQRGLDAAKPANPEREYQVTLRAPDPK
jgi:uncharacterized protein YjbJ (UPF0337 family)